MHCYPLLFLSYFQVTRQGPARPQESAILKTRIFFTRADSCRLGHKRHPALKSGFKTMRFWIDWLADPFKNIRAVLKSKLVCQLSMKFNGSDLILLRKYCSWYLLTNLIIYLTSTHALPLLIAGLFVNSARIFLKLDWILVEIEYKYF